MGKKEVKTKYFAEGVSADDNWIRVKQEGHWAHFSKLDDLKRSCLFLKVRIESASKDLRLIDPNYEYEDMEIEFDDPESAIACLRALGEALAYLQANTKDERWFDVPGDVFTAVAPAEK